MSNLMKSDAPVSLKSSYIQTTAELQELTGMCTDNVPKVLLN